MEIREYKDDHLPFFGTQPNPSHDGLCLTRVPIGQLQQMIRLLVIALSGIYVAMPDMPAPEVSNSAAICTRQKTTFILANNSVTSIIAMQGTLELCSIPREAIPSLSSVKGQHSLETLDGF
eukprot:Blabericola_migrator_1__8359@NODE_4348_length_1210_cov_8_011374_g2688_i0_p1_GENE_NODE_4348_length_1210_cov_8_011374_g2688_i0NODE_4348_length_1210_cov_8_011374_g2688_i0_p1_ORF_typecomplete_len121_score14_50_NODE_4348_length_1210_cov_8_011374_g2688_i06921054